MSDAILTPAQRQAIEADSHTVLIANAGSGKTFTLVEHYVHILESDDSTSPASIAAITFTENAAAELREKITAAITKRITRLAELSADPARIDRLWRAMHELDAAPISTIHGFCSRLLREHPIEAGIDPAFGILQGVERTLLVEETIEAVLHNRLRDIYQHSEPASSPMLTTFTRFGRAKIHRWIAGMIDRRFHAARAAETLRTITDQELDTLLLQRFEYAAERILMSASVQTALAKLESYFTTHADAEDARMSLNDIRNSTTPQQRYEAIPVFFAKILTDKGGPREKVFKHRKGGNDYRPEVARLVESALAPLMDLMPQFEAYADWRNSAPHTFTHLRHVVELYEESFERYTEAKLGQGLLDHDDLIDYGVRLLAEPHIAAEIAESLRHCLVDEYQDTDERQYSLLRSITAHFSNHVLVTIVGDPKQSIYRFRDADLDVFHDAVADLVRASHGVEPITLDVCFRMLPFPLSFANKVTDHIFGEDPTLRERYFYRPLVCAKDDEFEGRVTMLIAEEVSDEAHETENTSLSEEELIARSILERQSADPPCRFAEMAILLRDRKRLGSLEVTLRRYNIPYSLSGGLGFYQQQEIIDALTLLHVLIDPNDDLYLVALLRSPYVGIDDRTIWNLVHARNLKRPRPSLWDHLLASTTDAGIRSRIAWLAQLVAFTGRLDTVRLLERGIADSLIELTYLVFPDGEQKISNLRKFISLAARSELPVWEFVEQCTILQERDDREQQAIQPTDDAVHIMTIHASKGLEFPVVYLPYLSDEGRKRPSSALVSRHYPYIVLEDYSGNEALRHPYSGLLSVGERGAEREEELRILYVALTRAKNELVISATINGKKPIAQTSQLSQVLDSLGVDGSTLSTSDTIGFVQRLSVYKNGTKSERVLTGSIPIVRTLAARERQLAQSDVVPTVHMDLRTIDPRRGVTRYSPTQIETHVDCPTKYVLHFNLGLPEVRTIEYEHDPSVEHSQTHAATYGKLLHAAFERIDDFAPAADGTFTVNDEAFEALAFRVELPPSARALSKRKLEDDIRRVLASDLLLALRSATETYTELPVRFALQEHYVLSGVIDRLYCDADGMWHILDYKTTKTPTPEKIRQYEFQTKLYAFLVFKLFDAPQVATHLYFTSTGTTESAVYSDIDLHGFENELIGTIEEILAGRDARSFDDIEKKRSHCSECPYSPDGVSRCVLDTTPISIF
ncbi:MAG: UvrD-helicase domain-containing protein [Bacteroidetes bacterium]|nr:UvrD-helicase domain-containing protein [Bacteroidota bacterium]